MWSQVAEKTQPYGLTGLQMEISIREGRLTWDNVFKEMLEGFALAGNGFMAQAFVNVNPEAGVDETVSGMRTLMPILLEHPNAYRLNGHPVMSFYRPNNLTPAQWLEVMATIEEEFGRAIWLANGHMFRTSMGRLREYLNVFDGLTAYACWDEERQENYLAEATEIMDDFPQKIFEGTVTAPYLVHYNYGGFDSKNLTERFRESWRMTLRAAPESITITNFFDIYENTRIFPSYELEDIRMRISQFEIAQWRGEELPTADGPDLYVTNFTNVRIGEIMRFEVIGFPVNGDEKKVAVRLEICDAQSNVLHSFDTREMLLDSMRVEVYEIESEKLLEHRAVHPRLHYRWHGQDHASQLFPQTNLVTGMRPHMLFWARSVRRMIEVDHPGRWTMQGRGPGETAAYPEYGMVAFEGGITPAEWKERPIKNNLQELPRHGSGGRVRILRNGREIDSFTTAYSDNWDLNFSKPVLIPNPGGSLDWYNLEFENEYGRSGTRYLSPPIWMASDSRPGKVTLPILSATGRVENVQIEAVRVPFFHYRCDTDAGLLLLDSSGFQHHGYLGGKGYGGGHLGFTGYRHEHTPLTGIRTRHDDVEDAPQFREDEEGSGYLYFDGNDYVMMQGGTAFPYAYTYEMYIKPEEIGHHQGIMGAANRSIGIDLTEDGRIEAQRREGVSIRSTDKVSSTAWTHIAVVYDLKDLVLYINGEKQAAAEVEPLGYEMSNVIVLGGTCGAPYDPEPAFKGGIRQVRFYGRNLEPDEFLVSSR